MAGCACPSHLYREWMESLNSRDHSRGQSNSFPSLYRSQENPWPGRGSENLFDLALPLKPVKVQVSSARGFFFFYLQTQVCESHLQSPYTLANTRSPKLLAKLHLPTTHAPCTGLRFSSSRVSQQLACFSWTLLEEKLKGHSLPPP